jgi:hypothetical protein
MKIFDVYEQHTKSISAFDLILVNSGDCLEISGSASAGAFSVLSFKRPSV